MINLKRDLSTITTFSQASLDNLEEKAILSIAHNVLEANYAGSSVCDIDIGIGTLYIKYDGVSSIRYKFIPSANLDKEIFQSLNSKQSPLIAKVETCIRDKVETAYKNLI